MPKTNIDLGYSHDYATEPAMPMRNEKMYPSFHVETDEKIDFPHEGEMTIKFKKVSSSMSERNGKEHYSCTFEVRKITELYPSKSEDVPEEKTGAALDRIAKSVSKEKSNKSNY